MAGVNCCPACGRPEPAGSCSYDDETGALSIGDRRVVFRGLDRLVLSELWGRRGRLLRREDIFDTLYGDREMPPHPRILDVKMCKLRKTLDPLQLRIETLVGLGWKLHVPRLHGRDQERPPGPRTARCKDCLSEFLAAQHGAMPHRCPSCRIEHRKAVLRTYKNGERASRKPIPEAEKRYRNKVNTAVMLEARATGKTTTEVREEWRV